MSGVIERFAALIAPTSLAEVDALRRERRFEAHKDAGNGRLQSAPTWSVFSELIDGGGIAPRNLRVFFGRRHVPPRFYVSDRRVAPERLKAVIAQGVSLIISDVGAHSEHLALIAKDAARHDVRIESIQAVVTFGAGGALPAHYDVFDLVVLQVEGRKQWSISGPPAAELLPPGRRGPQPTTVLAAVTLDPGDLLFLPAGFWHECDSGSDRSLHLSFLMTPPSHISRRPTGGGRVRATPE